MRFDRRARAGVEGDYFHQALFGDAGVGQRVFQIASGYDEDQNDADTLRSDPLLKFVLGRLPETDPDDLASQSPPSLSSGERPGPEGLPAHRPNPRRAVRARAWQGAGWSTLAHPPGP